jgi:RimJ/RimL family protein N-acetyltransferase
MIGAMHDQQDAFIFSQIPPKLASTAHGFLQSASSTNPFLKPRDIEEMRKFAEAGELFGVRKARNGELVATCYAIRQREQEFEVGGLVVSKPIQNLGVATVLVRFVLAYTLSYEFPRSYTVVAYVDQRNAEPRPLLQGLGFEQVETTGIAPTLKDKFRFSSAGVRRLSEWFNRFDGFLKDGETPATIEAELDQIRAVLAAEAAKESH